MELLTELTRANRDPAVIEKVCALREQSARAEAVLAKSNATLAEKDFKIAALTLELAYYRRIKFGQASPTAVSSASCLTRRSTPTWPPSRPSWCRL